MNTIGIKKASITDLETDAIVNAANEQLSAGTGVCGAIFDAAGYGPLQSACNEIGHCDTGSAVITPGFNSKAKYIIHAVGPIWHGGKNGEQEKLKSAYKSALKLAVDNGCASIGFPLLSAGVFGYPTDRAWSDALSACAEFLDCNKNCSINIVFAVLTDEMLSMGIEELRHGEASIYKIAEKSDWTTSDMPEKNDSFILERIFTPQQMKSLCHGNIPQEMEDKWFWYVADDTLFAHRSWTGICVYRIDFMPDNKHVVTVNRDPEQYGCTSIDEDREKINKLLDWWTKPKYDYYNEWLSETYDTLKKSGKIFDNLKIAGQECYAVFFHKPDEENGYLSNWYPARFELDGISFSSTEQYIMYRKCMIFGDEKAAKAVLETDDPSTQQNIGKKAKGYIGTVWSGIRQMVAYEGLLAKFSQNDALRQKLLDTGDAYLVECARSDKIWACGIRIDDDRRFDASKWDGQNILGFALMQVRKALRH